MLKKFYFGAHVPLDKKSEKTKKKQNYHFLLFYHLKVFVLKSSTVVHAACNLACCQLSQQLFIAQCTNGVE